MHLKIDIKDRVASLQLNRPEALNALSAQMSEALVSAAIELDRNSEIGCLVIRGSEKAFCAGADIKELSRWRWPENLQRDAFSIWDEFASLSIPKIAAVSGLALGGGCELALMCDFIYAAKNAKIGQPELALGLIPGMGGTQRLVHRVGRARAKEMVLTGAPLSAAQALEVGLVNSVFDDAQVLFAETQRCAANIARQPRIAVRTANDVLDRAEESALAEGLRQERSRYFALWNTRDAQEGMSAFLQKREAKFEV